MAFVGISTEELEEELRRRREAAAEKAKPKPFNDINWYPVLLVAEEYIEELHVNGYTSEDSGYLFFKAVIEAVYGNDAFDWINKHL